MTDRYRVSEALFSGHSRLEPKNAVAAIILDEERRLLLQLRDDKAEIFFPNHWGCFGGAIEPGETPHSALVRELDEELGIMFDDASITPFVNIAFTPTVQATKPVDRHFFIVHTQATIMETIRLNEGRGIDWLSYPQLMQLPNVTPYDKFGIWLYFNQPRLTA